jgi:hypothetical protein
MHAVFLAFNAIISGTIATDAAQVGPARQLKYEASHQAPAWPFFAMAAGRDRTITRKR